MADIDLPTPGDPDDTGIWGQKLNDAIVEVNEEGEATKADQAATAASLEAVIATQMTGRLSEAEIEETIEETVLGMSELLGGDVQIAPSVKGQLAYRSVSPFIMAVAGSSTAAQGWWIRALYSAFRQAFPTSFGVPKRGFVKLAEAVASPPILPGFYFVNSAIAGTTAANYITSTTRAQLVGLKPRMFLHMISANDYATGVPVATFKATLAGQLDLLDAGLTGTPHQHLLIHQHERYDAGALAAKVADYSEYGDAMQALALERANVTFLDLRNLFATVGIPPSTEYGNDPYKLMKNDLIHLRPAGHALLAELLRQTLSVSGPLSEYPPATVLFSDSFNRADAASFTGQSTDSFAGGTNTPYETGSVASFAINGNALKRGTTGTTAFLGLPTTVANVEASIILPTMPASTPSDSFTIDIRRNQLSSTGVSCYRAQIRQDGSVELWKVVAGTATKLDNSVDDLYRSGDRVHIRAQTDGAVVNLAILIDGVTVIEIIDSASPLLTSAYVGMTVSSAVASFEVDSFITLSL